MLTTPLNIYTSLGCDVGTELIIRMAIIKSLYNNEHQMTPVTKISCYRCLQSKIM